MKKLTKNRIKSNEKLLKKLKRSFFAGVTATTIVASMGNSISTLHANEGEGISPRNAEVITSVIRKTPYYLGNSAMGFQDQGFHIYIDSSLNPRPETSFCVDPKTAIKNGVVYSTGVDAGSITPTIQRIAYLGYYAPEKASGNPNAWLASGEGEKAYINTQAMIWEQMGVQVRVNTPDYAQFKARINQQLSNWETRPSMAGQTIELKEGDTKTISDTNGVLSEFSNLEKTTDLGGVTVTPHSNNTVTIHANEGIASDTGIKTFKYNSRKSQSVKHDPTAEVNIIYNSTESQTLARMGYVDPTYYAYDINVKQKYESIDISKLDATTKQELEGATMQLIHKGSNKVVDEWVSGKTPHRIDKVLVDETYILREKMAVNGYDYAKDQEFVVDANGNVNIQHITMEDEKITGSLELTKLDADNGKEKAEGLGSLDNAEYEVIDNTTGKSVGKLIYDYDTKTSNKINGLDVTHEYTLKEIKAPKGYHLGCYVDGKLVSEGKIKFDWKKVQDTNPGNNNIVVDKAMKDSVTKVRINKLDNIDPKIGKHVKGATLTLLDKTTNKKVKLNYNDPDLPFEWVSDGDYLEIRGLELGHDYILQEIHAPNGYKISKDVEFKVENKEFQDVYMVDTKLDDVGVTKVDITTQEELPGAHLQIIDKETGSIKEEWISTEKEHIVKDLEVNKTYILKETIAPDGYGIAHQKEFVVQDNGAILQHEKMEDELLPSNEETKKKEVIHNISNYVDDNNEVSTGDKSGTTEALLLAGLSALTIGVIAIKKKKDEK